ncbi:MAG: AAA family ATPase, partial [Anaerolineae bacterium]
LEGFPRVSAPEDVAEGERTRGIRMRPELPGWLRKSMSNFFKYRKRYWVPLFIGLFFVLVNLVAFQYAQLIFGFAFQGFYLIGFMAIQVIAWIGIFFYVLAGRVKITTVMPGDLNLTWDDYRGQPELVKRSKAWVDYLKGVDTFEDMGGEFVGGILFEGAPGTGKTYLAKVIAAEAGIPFVSVEANSLLGTFMGIGPLKVGQLFRKVRNLADEYGGGILFIDEIDAIGGSRGAVQQPQGVGGTEPWLGRQRELEPGMRTPRGVDSVMPVGGMMNMAGGGILNTLLIELDGFHERRSRIWRLRKRIQVWFGFAEPDWTRPRVMVIGSTNRADILDPALVRPGRLGKRIHVDLPSPEGLEDIASYYLAKINHDETLTADSVARDSIQQTPNTVKFAINDAVILAHGEGAKEVSYRHWRTAVSEMIMGPKQPLPLKDDDKWALAVHEAGHAALTLLLMEGEESVELATIDRYGGTTLGHVLHVPVDIRYVTSAEKLAKSITVSMAGIAAEEVFLGHRNASAGGDLPAVQRVLFHMAAHGMFSVWPDESDNNADLRKEIRQYRSRAYGRAKQLLQQNSDRVLRLAEALRDKRELIGKEVLEIWNRDGEAPTGQDVPLPEKKEQAPVEAPVPAGASGGSDGQQGAEESRPAPDQAEPSEVEDSG